MDIYIYWNTFIDCNCYCYNCIYFKKKKFRFKSKLKKSRSNLSSNSTENLKKDINLLDLNNISELIDENLSALNDSIMEAYSQKSFFNKTNYIQPRPFRIESDKSPKENIYLNSNNNFYYDEKLLKLKIKNQKTFDKKQLQKIN